jgi:hypothetical protein
MASKEPHGTTTAQRAFELWQARGCPEGSSYEAERQLSSSNARDLLDAQVEESVTESFPASDAPASHLPDIPPSNAAHKWETANTKSAGQGR